MQSNDLPLIWQEEISMTELQLRYTHSAKKIRRNPQTPVLDYKQGLHQLRTIIALQLLSLHYYYITATLFLQYIIALLFYCSSTIILLLYFYYYITLYYYYSIIILLLYCYWYYYITLFYCYCTIMLYLYYCSTAIKSESWMSTRIISTTNYNFSFLLY